MPINFADVRNKIISFEDRRCARNKGCAAYSFPTWDLDAFLAPTTISNVNVTAQRAMRVPTVAAAVNLFASSIGSLPARITRTIDSSTVDATDHPVFRLVAKDANDRVTAGELSRALLTEDERDDYAIMFDPSALIAADTAARTDEIAKLRAAGVMTANDARRKLGLPIHKDGDTLTSPFTTSNSNDVTT